MKLVGCKLSHALKHEIRNELQDTGEIGRIALKALLEADSMCHFRSEKHWNRKPS
jgi:hypothetical protein